jgi:flagellin
MRISSLSVPHVVYSSMAVAQRQTDKALAQLATGKRIVQGGDDAAGAAIADQLDSYSRSYGSAERNTEYAQSYFNVAEGALNEQSNILTRLRELSVQAASDQFSKKERDLIQLEVDQLRAEFDRIARTTKFGDKSVLDGTQQTYEFQVGIYNSADNRINVKINPNTTAGELDLDSLDVSDTSDARESLQTVDEAAYHVAQARAQYGAFATRLDSTRNHLSAMKQGAAEAESRISDADLAESAVKVRRGQIIQQYQMAALSAHSDLMNSYVKLVA